MTDARLVGNAADEFALWAAGAFASNAWRDPHLKLNSSKDGEMQYRLNARRRARKVLLDAQQLESRQVMTVSFANTVYTATGNGGPATITLQDYSTGVPGTGGPATATQGGDVAYVSTAGGTAVGGVNFTPVSEPVTFQPGQTSQTVQIPILPAPASDGTRILALTISSSPGGSPTSVAFLEITNNSDTIPPQIIASNALTKGRYITGFELTFSKEMAPGPVQDVNNYAVMNPVPVLRGRGRHGLSSPIAPLRSAVYDPTTDTVTLTLSHRLKKSFATAEITISDMQSELDSNFVSALTGQSLAVISPITDTTGNPITGSSIGGSVGHFFVTVGVGRTGKKEVAATNMINDPSSIVA